MFPMNLWQGHRKIKETKLATQTNGQGGFRFENVAGTNTRLIVSYVGYEVREISFKSGAMQRDSFLYSTEEEYC